MAERRLNLAVPEVPAKAQARREAEHDLQVRAGLAARGYERLSQLDERLRLLAVLEADPSRYASRQLRSRSRSALMLLRTWDVIRGVAQPKNRPGEPQAWMATSVPSGASSSS